MLKLAEGRRVERKATAGSGRALALAIAVAALAAAGHGAVGVQDAISGGCPAFSPDGRRIAFQRERGDWYDLVVRDIATGAETLLETGGPFRAGQPAWGSDGSLAYILCPATNTSYEASVANSEDGCNIWLWKDGARRRLTWGRFRDSTPSFGPDGLIYFASTCADGKKRVPVLFTVDPSKNGADGRPEKKVIYRAPAMHSVGVSQPTVSPDGRLLVWAELDGFDDVWHICVSPASDTSKTQRLTSFGVWAYAPRWCPDSRHLVCTAFRPGDESWGVFMVDVRTGAMARLFTGEEPSVSIDGRKLVYERDGVIRFADMKPEFLPSGDAVGKKASDEPERVLLAHGDMENKTTVALGDSLKFGSDRTFFVRAEFDYDGDASLYQDVVRGAYEESDRGFNLYLAMGIPHFGTRDTHNQHFRVYSGERFRKGHGVLTGIRTRDALYLYVEGDADGNMLYSKGMSRGAIALDHPKQMVVGGTFKTKSRVRKIEVGTGWPANVPKPFNGEELFR